MKKIEHAFQWELARQLDKMMRIAAISALGVGVCSQAQAQSAATILTFPGAEIAQLSVPLANSNGLNYKGCDPALGTPLIGADAALYGPMSGCGEKGNGTIYRYDPNGTGEKLRNL